MATFDESEDSVVIEQTLVKAGLNGVKDILMKKVDAWKELKLSIAVIGNSGSGKSTFINAIRDLTADDEESADTGATETTNEPKFYIHPQHPNLKFWDLPGVGTKSFPRETYLEQVNFAIYDFFLILSSARFTENDCWLAEQIQRSGRKFFFIRTQIDAAIQGEKRSKPKSFNESDVLQKIRSDCEKNLKGSGLKDITVFLLSSFDKEYWDFQATKEKLIEDFPDLKKEALLFSLSCQTTKIINEKKEKLSRRILKVAVASAIGAAVPVPGASTAVDLAIITGERHLYRKQFGLDKKSLESTAKSLHLNINTLENKLGFVATASQLAVKQTSALPVEFAAAVSKLAISQTASDTVENLVRFSIPVIGSLLAAGVSYGATYLTLQKLLNDTESDAKKLAAFVHDIVKAHADTSLDSDTFS